MQESLREAIVHKYRFDWIENGKKIKELADSDSYWSIKEAEKILHQSEIKYKESKQKKWFIMVIFAVIGGLLGYYVPKGIHVLTETVYDRTVLDNIMDEMLAGFHLEDALTDEVMMVAYSFNKHEPRFYTKYSSRAWPDVYNITMAEACEASSATPFFFPPKVLTNPGGTKEILIDGTLIANNPSLYAFVSSNIFNKEEEIRVVSLGAGSKIPPIINPGQVSQLSWIAKLQDLLFEVEVSTHDYLSSYMADDYHRFQIMTNLELYNVDGDNIQKLIELGNLLISSKKEDIDKIVDVLVEDRFKPED